MSAEEMKAEFVSRAKLSEQAERYDDMAEYMRKVTESGLGNDQPIGSGHPMNNDIFRIGQ